MRSSFANFFGAARDTFSRHRWFILTTFLCSTVFSAVLTGGSFRFDYEEAFGSFYDYQAASLLQGRLDVPEQAISIEAFIVDGRFYGYFGPTPALLRVPLVVAGVGFGRLSRGFMLVYYVAALVAAYLILIEASRLIGSGTTPPEKWSVAVFQINTGLGSSIFFLSSSAYIYHEAILCGVTFALWSVWCALRHNAAPDGRWWIGSLVCGVLSVHARPSAGLFALTLLGGVALTQARRAWREQRTAVGLRRPLGIAALAAVGVLSFNGLSYLKFKTFDGCPLRLNVQYDPARLAKIDGSQFHLTNVPFAFGAYFLRPNFAVTKHFPYFQINGGPERIYPGAKLDLVEPTLGFPFAMPGLFALATLGCAAAFVHSRAARPAITLLLAAAMPMSLAMFAAVAISHRYTADFCPVLVCAAAFGTVATQEADAGWRNLLRAGLLVVTLASLAITIALTLRHQGESVWAVPEEIRHHYQNLCRKADAFFGVSHTDRANPDSLVVQGVMLWTLKRPAEAVKRFEAALRINPNHAVAHKDFAKLLLDQGRPEEALAHGIAALRIDPALVDAHRFCGEALLALNRVGEAIPHFETVLRHRPTDSDAHTNLGNTFFRAGRMNDALIQFREALRLDPAAAETHFNVGLALGQTGRTAEAIGEFEEALRLKPDFTPARDCLTQLRPPAVKPPPK